MVINPDSIPETLKLRPNWVLWKRTKQGKKPPYSGKTGKPIDITDSGVGVTFEQAFQKLTQSGRFDGVGLILNGDGLVGIDIDDCLLDETAAFDAVDFLKSVGCKYIELSPSGNGLHGLGLSDSVIAPAVGQFKSAKVEVYATKRYLTVTGHLVGGFPENGKIVNMPLLEDLAKVVRRKPPTQVTQVTQATKVTYDSNASAPERRVLSELPEVCIPTGFGTRNRSIFQLARYLKGVMPEATEDDLYPILVDWFNSYVNRFRTKELEVSWADFLSAWESVESPFGSTLQAILSNPQPVPDWMRSHRFGRKGDELLTVCVTLSAHHIPKPFFLSARQAGELIDMHFTDCAKLLKRFVASGYLIVAQEASRTEATSYHLGTGPKVETKKTVD
jgi:hypothetical protein